MAVNVDGAAHRLNEAAGYVEAEAEARVAAGAGGALEGVEDTLLVLRGDADTGVLHGDPGSLVVGLQADIDRVAAPVLEGVGEQIREHLVEAELVERACDRLGPCVVDFAAARPDLVLEAVNHGADNTGDIYLLQADLQVVGAYE